MLHLSLEGQGSSSKNPFECFRFMNWPIASLNVSPSTLQFQLLKFPPASYTWLVQAIAQALFQYFDAASPTNLSVDTRCVYNTLIYQLVHFDSPDCAQVSPRILFVTQVSQRDWMIKVQARMNGHKYSTIMHLQSSLLQQLAQSGLGVLTSTLTRATRFSMQLLQRLVLVLVWTQSLKTPESGIAQNFPAILPLMQSAQVNVARPPADWPPRQSVTLGLLKSLYLCYKASKTARVTLWPLKKRLVPLTLTGALMCPWWPVPVQQGMCILVMLQKQGLALESAEKMPPQLAFQGQFFEEPQLVLERLRHQARVWLMVVPEHHPPPSKLRQMWSVTEVQLRQQTASEPSRQRASGSVSLLSRNSDWTA